MNLNYFRRRLPFIYRMYLLLTQNLADKKLIGENRSFGSKNPNKTFLVIKLNNSQLGLMAIHNCVLGYLRIADMKGFIPVVDLMNFDNGYLEKEEIGKINAWEYFFEQPTKYTLDEVYSSKNVVFSSGKSPREASPAILNFLLGNKKSAKYYIYLLNKYIQIKSPVMKKINFEFNSLIDKKRVIAVSCRGSDMINLKGHAIQPTIQELLDKTKEMLTKWNCDYVFLATEEEQVVSTFRTFFGDKLLVEESCRISKFEEYKAFVDISFNRENDKYQKGIEYLTTIMILSKCNCLIGSIIGKTVGAVAINRGTYENVYFYDLGLY